MLRPFDEFTRQWFREVVLPEYRLHDPEKSREGNQWKVFFKLENIGTGTMPVEVAVVRGERFDRNGQASTTYRENRKLLTLNGGQTQEITFSCPFEPESIVVDPDTMVLQIGRDFARIKL